MSIFNQISYPHYIYMAFQGGRIRMKLLTKAHTSQRRLIEILRVIDEEEKPIGARAISDSLCNRGYKLGERAVRYNLKILDGLGFTRKESYSGRVLTPLGTRELEDALVDDRIGFVNTRIEEYIYRTTFNPDTMEGEVIANISIIDKQDYERVTEILLDVFDAGYAISRRILLVEEADNLAGEKIPAGCLGIATLCSITLDGMLLNSGIPVNTSFAGVVDIRDRQPVEFTDIIGYSGSSLDPMRVFMGRKMTRIAEAVQRGTGRVLANVREMPFVAADQVASLLERSKAAGIGGLIRVSASGEANLGCPVGSGKISIALYTGVNGPQAADELGIKIRTFPISALVEYGRMKELN
jgi:repressor of nif and glnA expression